MEPLFPEDVRAFSFRQFASPEPLYKSREREEDVKGFESQGFREATFRGDIRQTNLVVFSHALV
jgi:hypothetical protein